MGERTGLTVVEDAVLRSLGELGCGPDRPHRKSSAVVAQAERHHRAAPRHAYETLVELAREDVVHVRLVDGHGNFGTPDHPAASARYTEARLTVPGTMALASDAGALPPLPLALINGNLHVGGTRPPFAPAAVIDALELAVQGAPDEERLVGAIGSPETPLHCDLAGDLDALHAGGSTRFTCTARLLVEGSVVVIDRLPPYATPDVVIHSIATRVGLADDLGHRTRLGRHASLPLRDVNDESSGRQIRIVATPKDGVDPAAVVAALHDVWPIRHVATFELPAPMAQLLRHCVEGPPAAQLEALARLRQALP